MHIFLERLLDDALDIEKIIMDALPFDESPLTSREDI